MKDGPLDNSVNPMTNQLFVAISEVMAFGWECVQGQVLHDICSMADTSQT